MVLGISPELALKVVFAAGITNIVFLLLVLLSCRCMGITPIINRFMGNKNFQRFYSKHCYYWWLFIASVLVHTFMALYLFGNPFQ